MMQVKQEVRQLGSRYVDGMLMYPGKWLFTWVRAPFMPWTLASVEQLP